MNPLWTAFPDTLDLAALTLVYDAWRGITVDKSTAALACVNVIGYGAGKLLGQPAPAPAPVPVVMGAAPKFTTPEAAATDSAFQDAIAQLTPAPDAVEGEEAPPRAMPKLIPWGLILQVAMSILMKFLAGA